MLMNFNKVSNFTQHLMNKSNPNKKRKFKKILKKF